MHVKWCWFCPDDCAIEDVHHHNPYNGAVFGRNKPVVANHTPPLTMEDYKEGKNATKTTESKETQAE